MIYVLYIFQDRLSFKIGCPSNSLSLVLIQSQTDGDARWLPAENHYYPQQCECLYMMLKTASLHPTLADSRNLNIAQHRSLSAFHL